MTCARRGDASSLLMPASSLVPLGIVALALAACSDATASRSAQRSLVVHSVTPSLTDPRIGQWNADHYAIVDTAARSPRHQLLVFLPGTRGIPGNTQLFAAEAARAGYHVADLAYAKSLAILEVCPADPDPSCMERMRTEIITGANESPWVTVDEANGVDNRLRALIVHLAAAYPAEGWDQFLSDGAIAWDKVAVSGLSQGGGHAAMIAKLRTVARVIMFGAPADGLGGEPGPWVCIGATPADRYYGLAHARDPFLSIRPNWLALEMDAFGPVVTIERSAPPFGGTHRLTTDLLPATGSYSAAHPSVVGDGATPRAADRQPRLAPAWRYLLGNADR